MIWVCEFGLLGGRDFCEHSHERRGEKEEFTRYQPVGLPVGYLSTDVKTTRTLGAIILCLDFRLIDGEDADLVRHKC